MTAPTLVIVPCGKAKRDQRSPAHRLYTGGYFTANLDYARTLTDPPHIWILSGLHGLLGYHTLVEPYEQLMDAPGSITLDQIATQATRYSLSPWSGRVVGLGGQRYAHKTRAIWPHAETPLLGLSSMGAQISWLKEHTRG